MLPSRAGLHSSSRGGEGSESSRYHSTCCHQSEPLAIVVVPGAAHARASRGTPPQQRGWLLTQLRRSRCSLLTAPWDTRHTLTLIKLHFVHKDPYRNGCISVYSSSTTCRKKQISVTSTATGGYLIISIILMASLHKEERDYNK